MHTHILFHLKFEKTNNNLYLSLPALEEQNEELQATVFTRGVEEGRHLLNGTLNSLAQELEEMTQAQVIFSKKLLQKERDLSYGITFQMKIIHRIQLILPH